MNKIGIIADDLTGATTTGVLLAKSDINTVALLDCDKSVNLKNDVQAIVLSTNSRSLPKEEAQKKVNTAFDVLSEHKIIQYSKRIDTTMRGGIGYEVDAMLERLGDDYIAIMVPSMPQSNRILVGGYSIINGVALSKTDVANDVLTPIHDTHVPTLYRKQTDKIVGEIQLATILAGREALRQQFVTERSRGAKVIICDAVSLNDIETISEVLVDLNWNILAIDPGPFSNALANLRLGNEAPENIDIKEEINIEKQDKKVLMFVGSATSVTKEQINHLVTKSYTKSISINALNLIKEETREDTIKNAIMEIKDAMHSEHNVIVIDTAVFTPTLSLSKVEEDLSLNEGNASKRINVSLGKIAKVILSDERDLVAGLYLTGGDTMVSILKELEADGIALIDYVIPQTDIGRLLGGSFEGTPVIGKGGLTGTIETPIDSVKELYRLNIKGE